MNKAPILDENTQKQIHTLAASMAGRLAADTPPDALHPTAQYQEQLQLKLEQQIIAFFERYFMGIKELMACLIVLRQSQPDLDLGEIFAEFDKLGRGFSKLGENPDETRSLREVCNVSDSALEAFNVAVADLYNKKEYERASKVYAFLSFLEPYQSAYWLGYGNCEFFAQRFDKALPAYEMAVHLDGKDPSHHFYLAHCHFELNHKEQAVEAVNQALNIIKSNPALKEWLEKAEQLKQYFSARVENPQRSHNAYR